MLKRIRMPDLRTGMYLHRLEGPWMESPFWRSAFLLRQQSDLAQLHASGIEHCWIDTARGLDVEGPAADGVVAVAPVAAAPMQAPDRERVDPKSATVSRADEMHRAAAVCREARGAVLAMFNEARLGRALDAEKCLPLVNDITSSVFRNPEALISIARLKTRDDYTFMHSVAVCALMVALGRQLGLDEAACHQAGMAGLLHDLGKAAMPLEVLNKPGKLTDHEFALMRQHPRAGYDMLAEAGAVAEPVLDVCLHHHERVDGTGYPDRLPASRITLLARMGAVCDVYDAVTSNRPYKSGWDPAMSVARMAKWEGHFDANVFQAFVKSIGIFPTGSLVRLASNRLAVVVEQNPAALVAPIVKVFFSTTSLQHVAPQRVDLSAHGCSDRIVARETRELWKLPALDTLWLEK